jgi:gliding motility-associated protein GldM
MGGGKETPRQKMIGMMYLVLTALLAMNVSKQVLHGYIFVNESMERSRENLLENNNRVSEAFQKSIDGNPGAKPYYNRAVEAKKEFNEMVEYIEKVKHFVYLSTEKPDNPASADTMQLKYLVDGSFDNYDIPTEVLLGSEPLNPKSGPLTASELKANLVALHSKVLAMVDKMQKTDGEHLFPADYENLKKKLTSSLLPKASGAKEDGIEMTWEMENFYHLPEAAVIANLSKMQVDIKNAEAEILQVFSAASGKLSIKPDKLVAKVVAPTNYVQAGQEYTADIFLSAAFSKLGEGDMEVLMGVDSATAKAATGKGNSLPIVDGMGKYKVGTNAQGDQTFKGVIKFKKPDGTFEIYPFENTYKVAPPSVAVSADQMRVFYAGVVNPVSASAAGIAPADILINPTGAGVKYVQKGPGAYEFTFSGTGECLIAVSAKTKDGVKPQGPPVKFRVKPLPPPVASVGGKSGTVDLKKSELSAIGGVGANAPGFDFKANYIVMSFDVTGSIKGQTKFTSCTGNNLNTEAKAILSAAGTGSKIFFDNIRVKKPDGQIVSNVPGVTIKIKN